MVGRERGTVVAASGAPRHVFSKAPRPSRKLLAVLGVEADAHAGETVQHLHRMKIDPKAPNLARVHVLNVELFDEMAGTGMNSRPAPWARTGSRGASTCSRCQPAPYSGETLVKISGIRDPCEKIGTIGKGLTKPLVDKAACGSSHRKAGIMAIVIGTIRPGDAIHVERPAGPRRPLEAV